VRVTVPTETFLHRYFGPDGRLRPAAAPLHTAVIAQELLVERLVDALKPSPAAEEPLLGQLTALIKTFERPRILRRLLASIRRLYPSLEIVVVDDSRKPARLEGVKTIAMPYDSGISAGRNEGLRQVTTKYVLLLDDDVVFFRHTQLGPALALMERHPQIDIMGGQLIDLPFYKVRRSADAPEALFPSDARPTVPIGTSVGGLTVCAKVPNFFLARRDRLALVPWDPQLKRMEHADFFTRALGVLTTVFNPDVKCLHARTPFNVEYMQRRLDLAASGTVLDKRYGGGS
jgi:glycosyltransferase involved in cell wall biosynthesis